MGLSTSELGCSSFVQLYGGHGKDTVSLGANGVLVCSTIFQFLQTGWLVL